MKRGDVFPSRFLKHADLDGKPIVLVIREAHGTEQEKPVLYFAKAKKGLVLNITNWDSVEAIAGDDTVGWPGTRIELFPATTEMRGKITDCIRIRRPPQATLVAEAPPKAPPPPAAKQSLHDDLDDEIPW